jgi:uncharacterized RDD family membrane protein YckC
MSKERIEYIEANLTIRLLALLIDAALGLLLAVISHYGAILEWDILWSKILPESFDLLPFLETYGLIFWFVIMFPLSHILISAFFNGRSIGKAALGLRVVTTREVR